MREKFATYESTADVEGHFYFVNFPSMKEVNYTLHANHVHKAVELLCCYGGKMNCQINGEPFVLTKGQFLFINSFDNHYYEYEGDASVYIIVSSIGFLQDILLPGYEFNNLILPKEETATRIFSDLKEFETNPKRDNFLVEKALFLNICGNLYNAPLLRKKKNEAKKSLTSEILEYLDSHYQEDLDLETVANHFGYCTNYFSSLFNKTIGLGYPQYVNLMRMRKVFQLKANDNNKGKTMQSLIYEGGFSSVETFYRTYRQFIQRQKGPDRLMDPEVE